MDYELKKIKKLYGEDMAHYCRANFSSILETDGLLLKILTNNFYPTKSLYKDLYIQDNLISFKNYIYYLSNMENVQEDIIVDTPENLLRSVGYTLYECKTESDIQKFKKYYAPDEELCTFGSNRLETCYVWFAVKDNAEKLNRKKFKHPMRQDEYGTSVISIQFDRDDTHTLSIKNRYNHKVEKPDATFSNDLDNIVDGLTKSFADYKGMYQKFDDEILCLDGYIYTNDGKYYKYNYEINEVYFCPDNIIIDNLGVHKYPPEQYIIFDYYILDLKAKTITLYPNSARYEGFPKTVTDISQISILKNSDNTRLIRAYKNNYEEYLTILLNENNSILEFKDNIITELPPNYMFYTNNIQKLDFPNVKTIFNSVFKNNNSLKYINLPNVSTIGYSFLENNYTIKKINLPNVKIIGENFLKFNNSLEEIQCPKLEYVGSSFLAYNRSLTSINFPELKHATEFFLDSCTCLENVELPNLERAEDYFLYHNNALKYLDLPKLKYAGSYFLALDTKLEGVNFPSLEEVASCFLAKPKLKHNNLEYLYLPSLKEGAYDVYKNYKHLSNGKSFEECFSKENGLFIGHAPEENFVRKLKL